MDGWRMCVFGTDGVDAAVVSGMLVVICPNACTGHGVCNTTTSSCSCEAGYTGDDCSQYVPLLEPGLVVRGYVPRGVWVYYQIYAQVLNLNAFHAVLTADTPGGDPDLYVRIGLPPTLSQWSLKNVSFLSNSSVTFVSDTSQLFYLGVYGSVASWYTLDVYMAFSLAGWPLALVIAFPIMVVVVATSLLIVVFRKPKDDVEITESNTLAKSLLNPAE